MERTYARARLNGHVLDDGGKWELLNDREGTKETKNLTDNIDMMQIWQSF